MDVLGSALRRSPAVKQIEHGRARRMGRIDENDPGIGGGKPGAGPGGPGRRTMSPTCTSHALHGCEKSGEKATGPVGSREPVLHTRMTAGTTWIRASRTTVQMEQVPSLSPATKTQFKANTTDV